MIDIIEVTTDKHRKMFAKLPFDIYKGNKYWLPPIIKSEIANITPELNPFFNKCEAKFWIAVDEKNNVLGRIGAIVPHEYIKKTGEKIGRITRPEFFDNAEAVNKLFFTAEQWLKSKSMIGVSGPLGFSNIDTQALLVEGFDQLPSVASVYHLPYYQEHFDRLGYKKLEDWVEFNLFLDEDMPEKIYRVSDIVRQRYKLKILQMKNSEMMWKYGHEIFHLLNEAFKDLFSFIPFDDAEIDYILKSYIPLINPEFVHLVFKEDGKLIGFIIPVPSLSKTMQIANGKIGLRALISLIRSRKHNDIIDLFLTGVDPEYQSKGVTGFLMTEAFKVMRQYNIKIADTTGMLEDNQKALQNWKNFKHVMNKRKRCYIKYFD